MLQVVPVSRSTRDVRRNRGFAVNELVFEAGAPPLGYSTYTVSLIQDRPKPATAQHRGPTQIQNKVLREKHKREKSPSHIKKMDHIYLAKRLCFLCSSFYE